MSPTSTLTTILPLSVVLVLTAIKEIFEDSKRAKQDEEANNRGTLRLNMNTMKFETLKWKEVKVGDLIRVENGQFFPADLILVSSSEPDGLCYIETSNLDGETNLKIRQARVETSKIVTSDDAGKLRGVIMSEQPNSSLYTYEGVLRLDQASDSSVLNKSIPLDPQQLLLRGAMLRNTRWVYGVAVFTGHETKLLRNATAAPIKRTKVEKMTNTQILMLFILLIIMALISAFGFSIFSTRNIDQISYINPTGINSAEIWTQTGMNFLTFIVLYNNLIPISLIVTMEVVKLVLSFFINFDLDMYYEKTDTPALAKTSTIVEELGQIEYIFSDKTGTLTRNEMEFRECSIAGVGFAQKSVNFDKNAIKTLKEASKMAPKGFRLDFSRLVNELQNVDSEDDQVHFYLKEFFTLLATCHTVIPEIISGESSDTTQVVKPSDIVYQASSPDEAALLKGAQSMQYFFHTRKPQSVIVNINGENKEYMIMNVNEFNSTRKRMSAVVKHPDGRIVLYIKGADTVILERLKGARDPAGSIHDHNPYLKNTLVHLEEYATEGLRTLCLAMRELSQEQYLAWNEKYEAASTVINNRQSALDAVAEEIEKDLIFLGATAIEDKLQVGVPDTIKELASAGIKLWVLTGDKQETAINIGYSCKLLSDKMKLIILNQETKQATQEALRERLDYLKKFAFRNGILFPEGDFDPNRKIIKWHQYLWDKKLWVKLFIDWGWLQWTPERHRLLAVEAESPALDEENRQDEYEDNEENIDAFALVIDGKTLQYVLDAESRDIFLELSTKCQSVICCRVSPLQKALVVKLVKKRMKSITLAIGDGANDVGMIQAAHVGVGISGHEGLQAARSADFAISQFRYLKKLLLVHGTWSYARLSKVILFSFYKNITLYLTQFWFSFFNGFSGQTIYESWVLSLYNVAFTLLPPFAIGVFDQIVSARMLEKYPQMYTLGRKDELFNVSIFWGWATNAIFHSLILYFLVVNSLNYPETSIGAPGFEGMDAGLFYGGLQLYACVLMTVLLKAGLTVE